MNNLLIALLTASFLAGCAAKPRQGPPAPVSSAADRGVQTTKSPAPKEPTVDVYAYRPSSGTGSLPPDTSLSAEGAAVATTGTQPAPRAEALSPAARPPALPQDVDPGLAPAITWTPPTTSPTPGRAATAPAAVGATGPAPHSAPSFGTGSVPGPAPGSAQGPAPAPGSSPAAGTLVATAGSTLGPTTPASPAASPGASATKATVPTSSSAAAAPKPPPPPLVRYTAPPPPVPQLPAAAASLATQAEKQRESGDYVAAAATLERAIRIQPQEAYLWNRLARVRLDQKNYAQAGSLAQKSNALSKDQNQIRQDNWGMIATTRRATGDLKGAQEAEAKAGGQ